jgi:hypothetical protein
MAVIYAGIHSYRRIILAELERLAEEWPERDFWHTDVLTGPNSWSSRPCGNGAADIICHSPEAMRAALRGTGNQEIVGSRPAALFRGASRPRTD